MYSISRAILLFEQISFTIIIHVIVAGEIHADGRFDGWQSRAIFELNEIP